MDVVFSLFSRNFFLPAPELNWHPKTDGVRLIMCLILLKDEFLLRNGTLTRLALEGDKKAFWTLVAKLFNSANSELNELVGSAALLERYENLGLSRQAQEQQQIQQPPQHLQYYELLQVQPPQHLLG